MSTRATILIKERDSKVRLYHHYDGYPEGIGLDIKNFLKDLRVWDIEYISNKFLKGGVIDHFSGTPDKIYEFTLSQHGDEEFGYLIDCDKKQLKCYQLGWDEFDWKEEKVVEIP